MNETILDEQNYSQDLPTQETNEEPSVSVESEPVIEFQPMIEEPTIIESETCTVEPIVFESKIDESDKFESPVSERVIIEELVVEELVIVEPILNEISPASDFTEPEYVELDEKTLDTSTIPDSEIPLEDETEFFQQVNSIDWEALNDRSKDQISEISQPNLDTDLLNIISEINQTNIGCDQTDTNNIEQVDFDFKIQPPPVEQLIDELGGLLTTSQDTFTGSQDSFAEIEKQVNLEEQTKPPTKAPVFTQLLEDQEFEDKENVHLDCYVEGHQPILTEWYLNNELIMPSDDSNVEIFRELGVCSMEILAASQKYQGEFKCHASNAFGYDTTKCQLKMQEAKIEFSEHLRDQAVDLNTEVYLDCTVQHMRKSDRVEWYLNHCVLAPNVDDNIEIFAELGVCSLQIREMKHELQGFYSCKVINADGYIINETGCFLSIHEPNTEINLTKKASKLSLFSVLPSFVNELNETVVVREGDRLSLLCRLNDTCEPKPKVLWFRDGVQQQSGNHTEISYDTQTGECKLSQNNCDKYLTPGVYVCAAAVEDNSADSSCHSFICKTSTTVKVLAYDEQLAYDSSSDEKTSLDALGKGIAPMFLQSLDDAVLEEGDELELKCQIMGAPIPEVACFFAKNITEKTAIKRIRTELLDYNYETGIFRINIKNVSNEAHEGFYMVKALNDAGSLTTVCQVKIKLKSYPALLIEAECAPEFLTELKSDMKAMDGQEIIMTCICKALPEPEIKWFRSTPEDANVFAPIMYTNDIRCLFDAETGKATLKIGDVYPQDTAVYVCVASNVHGVAETRSSLTVESMFFNIKCRFGLKINKFQFIEAFAYEQDSEEGSVYVPSVNNTDTEGTMTPTPFRLFNKKNSDTSYLSDTSSIFLDQSKQLIKALRQGQKELNDKNLTENEYFSAQSDVEGNLTESSSNWK